MRALLLTILLATVVTPTTWAICSLPPPVEDPPREDPPPEPPADDPEPPDTPDDPPAPETPTTPPPAPPTGPTTPPPTPPPTAPPTGRRPSTRVRASTGARPRGPSYEASWRVWWELNREHMLGLRKTIRSKDVVTSGSGVDSSRISEEYRTRVCVALRIVADKAPRPSVRAAALRALGRVGADEDARRFLRVLRKRQLSSTIHEGAAIGLGCLGRISDLPTRTAVRAFFVDLLADRVALGSSSRRLAILALSIRGRGDPVLAMHLAARCAKLRGNEADSAPLLYASGLTRDPRLQGVVLHGVRGDKLRGRKLGDLARSRAVLGLALSRDPAAVPMLAKVLGSRRARVHTRRSAAIGLGMLMRDGKLTEARRTAGAKALQRAFGSDKDPLVRGYAAMGMGTAHTPIGIRALRKSVGSGDRIVRPYAAVALGLATARAKDADSIRSFLHHELEQSKDIERTAALSIAVGIARADQARDHLFDCLKRKRLKVGVRAPAIQALGLLRQPTPEIVGMLRDALDDKSNTVVEDASLALGFLGRRSTARMLVKKMVETKSESVQVHMVAALSHLGTHVAVDPLLKVLLNKNAKHTMRESAASALGILVDDRTDDPLFEIDAHTNAYGLTVAGRALVVVY